MTDKNYNTEINKLAIKYLRQAGVEIEERTNPVFQLIIWAGEKLLPTVRNKNRLLEVLEQAEGLAVSKHKEAITFLTVWQGEDNSKAIAINLASAKTPEAAGEYLLQILEMQDASLT